MGGGSTECNKPTLEIIDLVPHEIKPPRDSTFQH